MLFPFGQDEWWLCQEQNCDEEDRASPLEARAWVHSWLQELKSGLSTDVRRMCLLHDLVRKHIRSVPFDLPPAALVRRIQSLFLSGQLHVHMKRREGGSGSGDEQPSPAFPLADRQPRVASQPPPMVDLPVFSKDLNMSAQAAALVAAASSGTPFCQE
jgi:hypothetical protein